MVQAPRRFCFSINITKSSILKDVQFSGSQFYFFTMDTVASSPPSPLVPVKLIKTIYSTIQAIIKPKENRLQPIEIDHDWPYACNGERLPYLDCFPVQEHCIGLCQSLSYRSGRENRLYLSLNFLPLDWKSVRQIIKTTKFPTTDDSDVKYDVMMEMRHTEVENGMGKKMINSFVLDGHIMMRIITILPVDANFVVHGYSREKPSSQQSRCWHMSVDLERDCDELLHRIRKPIDYGKVDCPNGYYRTGLRRCESCPSEYFSGVIRTEGVGEGVIRIEGVGGDHGKKYPYRLYLQRWVDLGEFKKEEETQEFRALTAGQVCCDHSTRAEKPPIDCLWQGQNWSTIPSMRDRVERHMKKVEERRRKKWYRFWK